MKKAHCFRGRYKNTAFVKKRLSALVLFFWISSGVMQCLCKKFAKAFVPSRPLLFFAHFNEYSQVPPLAAGLLFSQCMIAPICGDIPILCPAASTCKRKS